MSNPIRAIAHVADATAECIAEILKEHRITAKINLSVEVEEGSKEAHRQMIFTYFPIETKIDKVAKKPVQSIVTKNMRFSVYVSLLEKFERGDRFDFPDPSELHREETNMSGEKFLIQLFDDSDDFPNVLLNGS